MATATLPGNPKNNHNIPTPRQPWKASIRRRKILILVTTINLIPLSFFFLFFSSGMKKEPSQIFIATTSLSSDLFLSSLSSTASLSSLEEDTTSISAPSSVVLSEPPLLPTSSQPPEIVSLPPSMTYTQSPPVISPPPRSTGKLKSVVRGFSMSRRRINLTGNPIMSPVIKKNAELKDTNVSSCDLFQGSWILDDSGPQYSPGSCPYVDDAFNCLKNGRPDSDYLRYRWKPHGCDIPRFDGEKMLNMLRGKRVVFVGDSLNRNMWQSLLCSLRESAKNKSRVVDKTRYRSFYSIQFEDYNCSVDFVRSNFLVQKWQVKERSSGSRETLRLDMFQDGPNIQIQNANIIVFNTGHWWSHSKTKQGRKFFQEGDYVHDKLRVTVAYTKALKTWARWVDSHINRNTTRVFFSGYTASHFRGGQWNSGGNCDGETQPITNETYLSRYPWMMNTLESVIKEMKTRVLYLNITKMSDFRKDGHPSKFRWPADRKPPSAAAAADQSTVVQDCSHWCLPGVPDSWNHLLYASLLINPLPSSSTDHSARR